MKNKNIKQFTRVGSGSYKLIKENNIKGLFYIVNNDGKVVLLDNSKGKMKEITFESLEDYFSSIIQKP